MGECCRSERPWLQTGIPVWQLPKPKIDIKAAAVVSKLTESKIKRALHNSTVEVLVPIEARDCIETGSALLVPSSDINRFTQESWVPSDCGAQRGTTKDRNPSGSERRHTVWNNEGQESPADQDGGIPCGTTKARNPRRVRRMEYGVAHWRPGILCR
jgi:hypothetical protein